VDGLILEATEMLINVYKTIKKTVEWIRSYVKDHNKNSLVVKLETDNIASLTTAILCFKSGVNTGFITEDYNDLDSSFSDLFKAKILIPNIELDLEIGGAMLDNLASMDNGIVVGWLSQEWYEARLYKKWSTGDILPLANLNLLEIKQMFEMLNENNIYNQEQIFNTESPNEFTFEEIRWALKEENITGILSSNIDPTKTRDWGRFTSRQRKIIAKLNQSEKLTKHKQVNIPICNLKQIPGLVR